MINSRIESLLVWKKFMLENTSEWQEVKWKAQQQNPWFTPSFMEYAIQSICKHYLEESLLHDFCCTLQMVESKKENKTIGIVMAGNIPLVGFHDFLSVFLSGHKMQIKCSSKDSVLLPHLIHTLFDYDSNYTNQIEIAERLSGCAAYIATGSHQSSIYFQKYFGTSPSILRSNKTSVAILTGQESPEELALLADDVYLFFGLGCRNVTKIWVPKEYNFVPLLQAFKKYDEVQYHSKYKNNFDYQLALYIINQQYYMSNESILLVENKENFSPISVLHYSYYEDKQMVQQLLENTEEIQCIVGHGYVPFGESQRPLLTDFADGINTIHFLNTL